MCYYICDFYHLGNEQGIYVMPFMVTSKENRKMCMVYHFPRGYCTASCIIFFNKADKIDGFLKELVI